MQTLMVRLLKNGLVLVVLKVMGARAPLEPPWIEEKVLYGEKKQADNTILRAEAAALLCVVHFCTLKNECV